jgi:hypothetical protein
MPTQLQNPNLRFVKIRKNDKRPFEPNWIQSGYQFNDKHLIEHILNGGNYGVIGGFGRLIILDFDSIAAYEKIRKYLPKTFSVITANKKLPHLYYYTTMSDPLSTKFCDEKKNTLIDLQGFGKQCVGPNSQIGVNQYKVWLDIPITTINYYALTRLLNELFKPMETILPPKKAMPSTKTFSSQRDIFDEITVPQILSKLGVKITSPTHSNCPMHCSVAEKCLHYNDKVWYCFNCLKSGGTVRLVMDTKNCDYKTAAKWVEKEFNLR